MSVARRINHAVGDFIRAEYTAEQINGSFKYLLASRGFRSIAISFTTSALPLYLVFVLGQGLIGVGAAYFAIILFVALTSFFFGVMSDRVGYVRTMIISEILPFAGLVGLTISTFLTGNATLALTVVIISAMLAGISTVGGMRGAFSSGQQALIANNWKEPKDRANRFGKIITIASVASIIGSLLLAFQGILTGALQGHAVTELLASTLSFRYMFAIGAVLLFLSILSLSMVKEIAKTEKKHHIFIKKESSPHMYKVMAAQIFAGIGLGLALPILPAIIAKAYALDSATASQLIGYVFGIGYVLIALASSYMSRLVYRKEVPSLKIASSARIMQGIIMALIAVVISLGPGIPYGAGFGMAMFGLLYSAYALLIGIGVPLRSMINIGSIHQQDYGSASAAMGIAMQIPQTSVSLSGFLSEAISSFIALPLALGGLFISISGFVYWKLLNKEGK